MFTRRAGEFTKIHIVETKFRGLMTEPFPDLSPMGRGVTVPIPHTTPQPSPLLLACLHCQQQCLDTTSDELLLLYN